MKQFFDSDDEFHSAMEEIIEKVPTTTTKEIFRSFLNIRPKVFDECYWQLNEFHKEFSTYIANHLTEAIDFIKNDCSEFDFVLLSEIFDEIVDNVKTICNSFEDKRGCGKYEYDKDFGPCFLFENTIKLENAIYQFWPHISFIFNDYIYKWTPDEYIFNDTNKDKVRGCMGFNRGGGRRFTLGSTWMIGHEIIFDRKNNKIGIAEANCDKNNNKSMNYIGIEKGYNDEMIENNYKDISLIDYLFSENMLNSYIVVTIILFLIIIYLVIVLINFKRRKPNAWCWFMEKSDNDERNDFLPIRYDINDTNKNDKNNKEFSMVFLSDSPVKKEIKYSNYSKINV